MLLVMAMRNSADYDEFWHLKMGQDWLQYGLSPWVDHYSFTFQGEAIKNPPVIFQAILAGLVNMFGEYGGLIALKVIAFLLILSLVVVWLRQLQAPVPIFLAVLPLLVAVLQFRTQVRPELFSFSFIVISFLLYRRSRLRLDFSSIAPIALLLAAWSAYHSSILGYVIFFGLFVDIAVRLLRDGGQLREWVLWCLWGLVLVSVGFANASLSHPLISTLQFSDKWNIYISEYHAPSDYLKYFAVHIFLLCTLAAIAGALIMKRFGYLLILAVFVYSGFTMARMVAPAMIVVLLIFSDLYTDFLKRSGPRNHQRLGQGLVTLLMIVLCGLSLFQSVRASRSFMEENRSSWTKFPVALVDHFKRSGMAGNIFNEYEMGGYLLYRLSPDSKVYIDGRTGILYPVEHYEQLLEAKTFPDAFKHEVERYDISYAVLQATGENASAMHHAGFSLDFLDIRYALYTRGSGSLQNFGYLWARPECIDSVDYKALSEEMTPYQDSSRAQQAMNGLLRLMAGYTLAENRSDLLRQAAARLGLNDDGSRMIAHAALAIGDYSLTLSVLESLEQRVPVDDITKVRALLGLGDVRGAAKGLVEALDYPWRTLLLDENRLQLWAIEQIEDRGEADSALTVHRERLKKLLETNGYESEKAMSPDQFCLS